MIKLNLSFDPMVAAVDAKAVTKMLRALNKELPNLNGELNAMVTSAEKLRQLNQQYAHEDKATDVLSFNYVENQPAVLNNTAELGDIAISADHVLKQAKIAKTSAVTELALLVLHGILHIFSFDHQDKGGRLQMNELQAKVMKAAGLTYRDFGWLKH